jgi:sigma-E factor negative regulatory protein RseA
MKESISALMDGELDGRAEGEAIESLRREGEATEAWRTYHLIGDAIRDSRSLSPGFAARVAQRLATEPTVLAPTALAAPRKTGVAFALAAGLAAVGFVGWVAFAPQPDTLEVAVKTAPALAVAPAVVPIPSAANDYLLAHQGFSPRVSLQGMAPYVRTVADHRDAGR